MFLFHITLAVAGKTMEGAGSVLLGLMHLMGVIDLLSSWDFRDVVDMVGLLKVVWQQ